MFRATKQNDHSSLYAIRVSMRVFEKLCTVLVFEGGLKKTKNVEVEEMVVMFLHTMGQHIKNRILQQRFGRSGSSHDGRVLRDAVTRPNGLKVPKVMPRKRKAQQKEDNDDEKGRPYFSWNDDLDQLLVRSMMTLVESRKIDEKGKFVPGAYVILEEMMEQAQPGCGVKADPNIMSRVKTLKQKFLAVQELRGLREQNHPHCAKLNKVAFPCYDALEFVYGKTRATGASSAGLEELRQKAPCPEIEVSNNLLLGWDKISVYQTTEPSGVRNEEAEFVAVDDDVPPVTPTDKAQQSDAASRPKRIRCATKSAPATEEVDELKPILKAAVDNLHAMTSQSDQTITQKDNLYEEVENIEGISADEAVDAAFKLVKDADLLRLFYGMRSAEARKRLIERVLRAP
ncbi:hypothetical protein LINGRAHAP2_LOCUS8421 [Linum grandiflorum]